MNNINLTKADIAKELSIKKGYSNLYSKKIINDLVESLSELIKENNLVLKNIGYFKLINKKERVGRNPKTKKIHLINARKSVGFYPSKSLVNTINEQ